MPIEQLIILAIVQGLSEFLPISSSGHLNLLHALTDWADQGVLIDAAVHVGSLFAVFAYFWRDILKLIRGFYLHITGEPNQQGRLALYLALATVPLLIVGGYLLKTGLIADLRTAKIIAWANIIFALVLFLADRQPKMSRDLSSTKLSDALLIGLAQVAALIPGASRAGVTISMARALGFDRRDAARFSMLLSIPAISGVGMAAAFELHGQGELTLGGDAAISAVLSFLAAFASIWFMMTLLKRMSLTPFVIYRIVLGAALLGWIYS